MSWTDTRVDELKRRWEGTPPPKATRVQVLEAFYGRLGMLEIGAACRNDEASYERLKALSGRVLDRICFEVRKTVEMKQGT